MVGQTISPGTGRRGLLIALGVVCSSPATMRTPPDSRDQRRVDLRSGPLLRHHPANPASHSPGRNSVEKAALSPQMLVLIVG